MKKIFLSAIVYFVITMFEYVCLANRYYDENIDDYGNNNSDGGLVIFFIIFLYFWLSDKILTFLEEHEIKNITLLGLNLLIILAIAWFIFKGILGLFIYSSVIYISVRFFPKNFYINFTLILAITVVYLLVVHVFKVTL